MKAFRNLSLIAVTALGIAAPVEAQSVRFQGVTGGCFFTSGPCTPSSAATFQYLSFTQGSFNAMTTSTGFLGLGGASNNLGTFDLGSGVASYDGARFLLQVLFDLPLLTSSNAIYTAAIIGSVQANEVGGVYIAFDDSPQVFNFSGPGDPGYFSLSVNDVSVTGGDGPVALTGVIRTTVTPEPASMALLGTGLIGLIPAARRRLRKKR